MTQRGPHLVGLVGLRMPSAYVSQPITQLNLGVNLRGLTGGVNMKPGEAQDALDIMFREDGAFTKHWGWERLNSTALTGRPLAIKGFAYKGKNATVAGDTARAGNYGVADDGADFTRRLATYSGCVVLTTSTFYRWDAATRTFETVSLPGGVTADPQPKPSIIVYNNNLYIAGWADFNLRYDPTDEALYLWGWAAVPAAPTSAAVAGGSLIAGATYLYAYTHYDVYTGEESGLGAQLSVTPSGGDLTRTITVASYTGTRHFNTAAVATDRDVGVVLYRTDADRTTFNFLGTIAPGTTTFSDTGLATDSSIQPFRGTARDEPRFSFMTLYRDQFYAVSQQATTASSTQPATNTRVHFNSFEAANSFVERWEILGYIELPVSEGELLTALNTTDREIVAFTQKGAFTITALPNYSSGRVSRVIYRLPWMVGCVGPKAVDTVNGWVYFLSERGPYRWRSGLGEPQWIGKYLLPLFIDHTSGLCQLNPGMMLESEVKYDQDANTVRFIFACGTENILNRNIMYWIDADKFLPDPAYGWTFCSPTAQCFDRTNALGGTNPDGTPPDPLTRSERLVFGDSLRYISAYEPGSQRAGLPAGSRATGTIVTGTSTLVNTLTTAANPLFTDGNGLAGMRFEIVYASDGLVDVVPIASNTATVVTLGTPLSRVPGTSDTWYVAGIPSFWRSWVDHAGDPHTRKTLLNLYMTYMLTDSAASSPATIDVEVLSGDRSLLSARSRTANLNDFNDKLLISRSGLYFTYEFANTRPDEMFTVVAIEPEMRLLEAKRKE